MWRFGDNASCPGVYLESGPEYILSSGQLLSPLTKNSRTTVIGQVNEELADCLEGLFGKISNLSHDLCCVVSFGSLRLVLLVSSGHALVPFACGVVTFTSRHVEPDTSNLRPCGCPELVARARYRAWRYLEKSIGPSTRSGV